MNRFITLTISGKKHALNVCNIVSIYPDSDGNAIIECVNDIATDEYDMNRKFDQSYEEVMELLAKVGEVWG